jgi:spermidine synthase
MQHCVFIAGSVTHNGVVLFVVLALFAGSGAAALIYEIVWLQLLQLIVGSSTASMGMLLAAFMGGTCLGSVAAPRLVARRHHPLRVYAWLEIAVGVMAVALLFVMPLVDRVYAASASSLTGYGAVGLLLRAALAAMCLVPPTVAMGATLPVIARWVESPRAGASSPRLLGFFYAANIAGAVGGSLLAGFYLLRVYDMTIATFVAAGINVIVAAAALWIASINPVASPTRPTSPTRPVTVLRPVLVIAMSGFCALAAEVVWTRLLALLFGATVYTFSIILAVFLVGLGLGSGAGSWLARKTERPLAALGWCQLLAAAGIVWSAYALMAVLPYWTYPVGAAGAAMPDQVWLTFRVDFGRALLAILPAPLLWGASFPLALAALSHDAEADPAQAVGRVYAANTIGAIAGALGASLLLVGSIGSQHTQQLMIVMSAVAGVVAIGGSALPALAAVLVTMFALLVPPLPGILVAYGRHAANWSGKAGDIFYVGEGTSSSVAVSRTAGGVLNYHNAGKIQASSEPQDMRLQRMLGHLTTLVPPNPRSVLVIGCGAGVTAGAVSIDPQVERVTIAEIEPLVPRAAGEYFGSVNANVIRNPKVRVQIDDARHFLLTTKETFDAITSDPLDPWVKGAATLYTKEFFELAKAHLNPGGAVTLFVQLYESSPDTVRSEIATFFDAFPNGTIWGNTYDGVTADTVLIGTVDPIAINVDDLEWKLVQPAYAPVRLSLGEIGFFSGAELLSSYGGRAPELAEWLRGASINRDRNLRLQYLAGLGFNMQAGSRIYADILKYRTFPWDLFIGSSLETLRETMEGPRE